MRTTLRLNDDLLRAAKQEAARRGSTLTALVESGLRLVLARRPNDAPKRRVELPTFKGRLRPGVDLDNSAALWDLLDTEADG